MIRGFYSGASSLTSQQINLNTISNNLANVGTTGYKPQQAAFSSLMYQTINGGAGEGNTIQTGNGVRIQKTGIDFNQGELNRTDIPTDCAILGEGFFAIEDREDGTITYTRDGCFKLSVDGSNSYLVNGAGNFVLGEDENRIEIKAVNTAADSKGGVKTEGGFDPEKIGAFVFPNKYGLELAGGNQYRATEASGEAEALEKPKIKAGYLENSRVQLAQEMVRMIEASKGFSFASKIVQTADEMEKIINQLR
ncbi:MAG: flagellar hook-basal body protein [Eubacteriales bacterium]|nr:flagellar hook-basal body protein [Eubacteriales bacterium]MDD3199269.1 flagellar hook-basal body protein [Eubacteriales bacterium]MDD4122491.1 flagellar hook-basal body protein [Eubacteriales bacterium]MDD4629399.1 flagellar hook-basal body protein [Eubacteriales bacterium]